MNQALNLKGQDESDRTPFRMLVRLIIKQAILDKADEVVFELNQNSASQSFRIAFRVGETEKELSPSPVILFEPATRVLLNLAEIPYWKKGDVVGEFETQNPCSKWKVKSSDLARRVCLERLTESSSSL